MSKLIEDITKSIEEDIFRDSSYDSNEDHNSCEYHMLCHDDTEILGQFCDYTGIHGEDLKKFLLNGYIHNLTRKHQINNS